PATPRTVCALDLGVGGVGELGHPRSASRTGFVQRRDQALAKAALGGTLSVQPEVAERLRLALELCKPVAERHLGVVERVAEVDELRRGVAGSVAGLLQRLRGGLLLLSHARRGVARRIGGVRGASQGVLVTREQGSEVLYLIRVQPVLAGEG